MKSRLLLCAMLVAVFAVPAFADSISISFTNQGVLSGSLNSGISSVASDLAFNGTVIQPGPFATLNFDLGTFTGSLNNGGTFTGGTFELDKPEQCCLRRHSRALGIRLGAVFMTWPAPFRQYSTASTIAA
jgi:hypothetical protein